MEFTLIVALGAFGLVAGLLLLLEFRRYVDQRLAATTVNTSLESVVSVRRLGKNKSGQNTTASLFAGSRNEEDQPHIDELHQY